MAEPADGDLPIFSERLSTVLDDIVKGVAPNVGRFCGRCYTPMGPERTECPHCARPVAEHTPVGQIPPEVLVMYRQMRRREGLVVNGFAYLGLALGVFTFIVIFYVLFTIEANVWWFVGDIVLLFLLSRGLAGILGGFVGDELGFRYARRKLAEGWAEYETGRNPQGADLAG